MTAVTPFLAPEPFDTSGVDHQRADVRNNMFVMAALYSELGSGPARIRNLSRRGALIESAIIPPEQSSVRLSRGTLSACAKVAWRKDDRAGIEFEADVEVADWLPKGSKVTGQQRIDEIVHACRTAPAGEREGGTQPAVVNQAEAVCQLLGFRDTLNGVAEQLAGDMAIAMHHSIALQKIDVTAQLIDKLAMRLAGPA
jgi:hypothetical protein